LPEAVEYVAIRLIIGVVINAARKKWTMKSSIENAGKMKIPVGKDASDKDLSEIIE